MTEQRNEFEMRSHKLQLLHDAGVIPYANKFTKDQALADLITLSEDKKNISDADILMQEGAKQVYSTAGRMMLFRTMGKLSFATIRDHSGDIQIAFVK
jgi:lysyl-tRNA synthetase class 2